jgi:hypothetical protein
MGEQPLAQGGMASPFKFLLQNRLNALDFFEEP